MQHGSTYVTLTKSLALQTAKVVLFFFFFFCFWFGGKSTSTCAPAAATPARGVQARLSTSLPPVCNHECWFSFAKPCTPPPLRASSAAVHPWKRHARTEIPRAKLLDCLCGKFIIPRLSPSVASLHRGHKYMCFYRATAGNKKLRYIEKFVISKIHYEQV